MNIVLISSALIPHSIGGIEVLTLLLAKAFVSLGHTTTIITGGNQKIRQSGRVKIIEIPELSLPCHLKSFLMPFYAYRLQKRLEKMPSVRHADIVNAMDLDSIVSLTGWNVIFNKFVATIQDYGLVCANGLLLSENRVCANYCHQNRGFLCLQKRKISPFHKIYLHLAYRIRKRYRDIKLRQLRSVICVSSFVARQIIKIAPHIHTEIIGNCVPWEWLIKQNTVSMHKDIDILYAGRLEQFKGIGVFIHALQKLSMNKVLTIYFIGGGKVKKYQQMIHALNLPYRIRFFNAISFDLMKNYYARSRIVVVPSVWPEPCGRVIIEGMFWKCVVVSTHRGGTPELITHGKNGILVKPNNATDLAQSINSLLQNPIKQDKISSLAKRYSQSLYTEEKIAQKYINYYKNFLSRYI